MDCEEYTALDLTSVPPMVFVASGIFTITSINMVNRLAINSIKTRWGLLAANYTMALVLSVIMFVANGLRPASISTIALGFVTGLFYISGMYLGMATIRKRGASIAVSASQLSVLISVGLSVAIFGESLRINQIIGVVLAIVSLPLLAARIDGGLNGSLDRETLILIIAQILVQGFAQFSSKVLVATGLGYERDAFFLIVFLSATLTSIPVALKNSSLIMKNDFVYGGIVGVCNIGGNLSILLALTALPGAIVFPLVSSGGLLVVTFLARLIFKERISRVNTLGIVLTLAAVLLINF
jgi:drug/metabolite transporter (DMT)-like permease